ncbi:MAG TPA: ATP-binding protein [Candidatus Paceibacterota bacterium]|nr:ATP-binding protein [Verrucomicrobiota bacterium]HSA10447.1 ATP-binding protein [Candidatus Paceibacterota bacterium]
MIEQKLGGGGARTLHVSATLLKPGKKGSGVILVLTDLTPTRQLDERLEQLDRLASIGTLAASMAHEIRNALVAGRTFVDLLLEKHQDTELVGVVRRELGRIDEIVSRILKFGGPARPALRQVRLHEVLDHSLRLVQPQLNGKQVLLSRSFQAVPDLVKGDDCQLQQAFVNLFLNALEAMGPNGTLSVTTELVVPGGRADRTQVQVAIQDSGLGIPPEHLERVFEPFFTSKPSGTGLGLPITRRIIREHRGDIRVVSRPSKGSDFRVLLPVSA